MAHWFLQAPNRRYLSPSIHFPLCPTPILWPYLPRTPPMPTDETRPMDSGDRKHSRKSFSEDGRGGTEPVSVHGYSFYAVFTIEADTWNETRSSLQFAFLSPLLDYNINWPAQYTIDYTLKAVHSNRITLSTPTTALSAGSSPHQWDPLIPPPLSWGISAGLRA